VGLIDHPDRLRWNERYQSRSARLFQARELGTRALACGVPSGRVVELAGGLSGTALMLAGQGRDVSVLDVSDAALGMLREEAARLGLLERLELVHMDLAGWRPAPRSVAMVIATMYWDSDVFRTACDAVAAGGLLAWEALSGPGEAASERGRERHASDWWLRDGEPESHLDPGMRVLHADTRLGREHETRWLIARRLA
jgi:hypothetical protein